MSLRRSDPNDELFCDGSTLEEMEVPRLPELVRLLLGDREPEFEYFQSGDVLVHEGQRSPDPRAWLVAEGELEERMTAFLPGLGLVEQPLFLVAEGDLANLQALVHEYRTHPSLCSVHAVSDGHALVLRPEALGSAAILVDTLFRKATEATERERQMLALYGAVISLFQNAPGDIPLVPADPHQLMKRLVSALAERGYLAGREAPNSVAASFERLSALESQLRDLRRQLEDAERSLSQSRTATSTLEQKCNFEKRARAALEQRVVELMQQVVEQKPDGTNLSSRFPTAICILESTELDDLERAARRHRELAEDFESRARRLHRAIELLERDNENLIIADDVMLLMLGEEPPERPTARLPTRDTMPMLLDPKRPLAGAGAASAATGPVACPSPHDAATSGSASDKTPR
ncbi:MAG: hypothetical protein MUF54_17180 [Polyangiaceae bacterium]|jgi:hypothetical protein|nr:hypothetical protein [Polyangiaceae bacterium]